MFDGPTQASFEVEDLIPLGLNDLLSRIERCESILSTPPDLQPEPPPQLVKSLKIHETSPFAVAENETISNPLQQDQETKLFISLSGTIFSSSTKSTSRKMLVTLTTSLWKLEDKILPR